MLENMAPGTPGRGPAKPAVIAAERTASPLAFAAGPRSVATEPRRGKEREYIRDKRYIQKRKRRGETERGTERDRERRREVA